ncbi:MAG: hypothetical protein H6608_02500 [Flavobacteriales bacterium]|nr:hypothetical protein [Bacteroidota bacterium]MCB9239977.1 hypothetical protein [Flavobacteriales bacterium]
MEKIIKTLPYLFCVVALLACNSKDDCISEEDFLLTGWEILPKTSESMEHKHKILSSKGVEEEISMWATLKSTYVKTVDQGNSCVDIRENRIHGYMEFRNYGTGFSFDFDRHEQDTKFEFTQRTSTHSLDEANYVLNLTTGVTEKNTFDFAYYMEKDINSDVSIEMTKLDSLVTPDTTFRNLLRLSNKAFLDPRVPNSCLFELTIDSAFGVVQFKTNNNEEWNVIFND